MKNHASNEMTQMLSPLFTLTLLRVPGVVVELPGVITGADGRRSGL